MSDPSSMPPWRRRLNIGCGALFGMVMLAGLVARVFGVSLESPTTPAAKVVVAPGSQAPTTQGARGSNLDLHEREPGSEQATPPPQEEERSAIVSLGAFFYGVTPVWLVCWVVWLGIAGLSTMMLAGSTLEPDEALMGVTAAVGVGAVSSGLRGTGFMAGARRSAGNLLGAFLVVPAFPALHLFLIFGPLAVAMGDDWFYALILAALSLVACYAAAAAAWAMATAWLAHRSQSAGLAAAGSIGFMSALSAGCMLIAL